MNLTISINGQNLEDFYIRDEDDSESPPMTPGARSPRSSERRSSSPRVVSGEEEKSELVLLRSSSSSSAAPAPSPSPPASGRRGALPSSLRGSSSAELDLSASPEATLNLSFSPRSSGKLKGRRKSRKRNGGGGGGSGLKKSGSMERSFEEETMAAIVVKRGGPSGVRYVLPASMTELAEKGLIDVSQWTKFSDQLKKVSRSEYKAIVKSTRPPRTWAEKLQMYPSATSYLAYAKNRYRDVLADEHTRVKLLGMEHDYINANYIEGSVLPGQPKCRYIATQAPLPATMEDFWWMVWQEKSCVIVMLTKLREKGTVKAHPYWPKHVDEEMEFGSLRVTLAIQKSLPGIMINTLRLTKTTPKESGTRIIYHLFYTEWPDFGTPRSSRGLRNLITYANLYSDLGATQGTSGPLVLHCSAGIGRTGTFLAVHAGISLIDGNVVPDVNGIVSEMRKCRTGMVQTDAQYVLIYEALNEHIQQQHNGLSKKVVRVISASSLLENSMAKCAFRTQRGRSVSAVSGESDLLSDEDLTDRTEELYSSQPNDNNTNA